MSFLSNQARVVYERFGSLTPLLFIIIVRKDCWLIKYKLYIERKRQLKNGEKKINFLKKMIMFLEKPGCKELCPTLTYNKGELLKSRNR